MGSRGQGSIPVFSQGSHINLGARRSRDRAAFSPAACSARMKLSLRSGSDKIDDGLIVHL